MPDEWNSWPPRLAMRRLQSIRFNLPRRPLRNPAFHARLSHYGSTVMRVGSGLFDAAKDKP